METDVGRRNGLDRIPTGISGLDELLLGGLPVHGTYLVEGEPGTGKTLFSVQFLNAGVEQGDVCLFVSLSQRISDLKRNVEAGGLTLAGIKLHDFSSADVLSELSTEQVVFRRADVELGETLRHLLRLVDETRPDRVVFDGMNYIRMLADDQVRYRNLVLGLRNALTDRKATVLFTDDPGLTPGGHELQSLVHGVIHLTKEATAYGNQHRRLSITKMRGTGYQSGFHDFTIKHGGLTVYPRLVRPSDEPALWTQITSGVDELDTLLGGGLAAGTSCLVVGPSGTGKTSVSTLYLNAAAQRGENASVFLFDELKSTFRQRSEALGMPISEHEASGRLVVHHVPTGELSAGMFIDWVRREVDERDAKVILIDTLTGVLSAMPDERLLITIMHDLLTYLSSRGVLTILVVAQHGIFGFGLQGPVDVSYLADAVVLMRHFETNGALRQAVSVFKKRYGSHERRIRQLELVPGEIKVGKPITEFQGVLTGVPTINGNQPNG